MNTTSNPSASFTRIAMHAAQCLKWCLTAFALSHTLWTSAVVLTPLPPFLTETKGSPMVMLNLSRDHQLFYKAYNEFTDLDGDDVPETTYKHDFGYYGYFDNRRCYVYSTTNERFEPTRIETANVASTAAAPKRGFCGLGGNEWHGNFLNWATMTRMDVVRRILYGGFRSSDGAVGSPTVLERAHLPTDAHAFAKYYKGTDINLFTPFTPSSGEITICNASFQNGSGTTNRYSHNAISPPRMLVANGNFSLWNANERWQCYWREDPVGKGAANNSNVSATSGITASAINPSQATHGLGNGSTHATTGSTQGTYTVRVEVCKEGLGSPPAGSTGFTADETDKCKFYPAVNYKPVGLLQKYGERNEAGFGLITGSYQKNISGGVLRKNVGTFIDEVDLNDGRFKTAVANGIVKTLDNLRIYGYDYANGQGTYIGADSCSFQQIGLTDGTCVSWGNPMGEMYQEALRYLAGQTANPAFTYTSTGSKDAALGLTISTWTDPFAPSTAATFGDPICRATSIVNFNASVTSYDNNPWPRVNDPVSDATAIDYTNQIGLAEGLYASGKKWSIGSTAAANNKMCNEKTINPPVLGVGGLADAVGVCPEAPTYAGGFKMAGAAFYAHTNKIRDTSNTLAPAANTKAFRVDTYGVALSTSTPRIKVRVPGSSPATYIVILPAYRLDLGVGNQGGGTLVDFRVVSQSATAGKYLIQWEDSEQGGDYDQDVWGTLEYSVVGGNILVSTQVIGQSTANPQGFGYVISGVTSTVINSSIGKYPSQDGVHFHSGIIGYTYSDPTNPTVTGGGVKINATGGCQNCQVADPKTTATYRMEGGDGNFLQDPLWYAAKYGGFDRDKARTALGGTTDYTIANATAGTPLPADAWDTKDTKGNLVRGGDGKPDNFFYAIDPSQLEKSLEQIFAGIIKAGGSAPAAATSRTAAGGYVYVGTQSIKPASVSSDADASGEFFRYPFTTTGGVSATADWDAGARLTTQVASGGWSTDRRVFTLSDTGPTTFLWSNLSVPQQDALRRNPVTGATDSAARGQQRLEWLRGDTSNETTAGGLRQRTKTKLGAIINSSPWYMTKPSAGYSNVDYGGGYGTFLQDTNNRARQSIFVAANDGMLHAFDADTGYEQFAYVPRALYTTSGSAPYSKLAAITDKAFSLNTGTDRINVDGSVMAADIKVGTTPIWRTYLFGALGRGAKGIYALDVTTPQSVAAPLGETPTNAASIVKWEFTDAADSDLGYVVGRSNSRANGQPTQVGYMANGKWAAIYGNGYNSSSGNAALFILFADGPPTASPTAWTAGTHYVKLATGTDGQGPNNGLATPYALDKDNDGVIDFIYAGDLKGNVWKFDVTNANPINWGVATQVSTTNTTKKPLFTAESGAGTPQPITTTILPFRHPQGGTQLVFGTGKALESTDFPMATLFTHTIYGIFDQTGSVVPITTGRTGLVQKTISNPTPSTANPYRYLSTNTVNYLTDKGWFIDLPTASEGVVFNPLAQSATRVNIRSLAPEATSDGCRYDSTAFDFTFNPISGLPIDNLITGAPVVGGYGAAGSSAANEYEFSKGGTYRIPTPPPSTTSCVAGSSSSCICNPLVPTQCVLCPIASQCNPPWSPLPGNQCSTPVFSATSTSVNMRKGGGICPDGRLTWREIMRNR